MVTSALSIGGSRAPLDAGGIYATRLFATLCERYQPESFSEHLAWSSHDNAFLNDLLPLPYTDATLALICDHIDQVQEKLGRQMLLENPSTYVAFAENTFGRNNSFCADSSRQYRLRPPARRSTTSSASARPIHGLDARVLFSLISRFACPVESISAGMTQGHTHTPDGSPLLISSPMAHPWRFPSGISICVITRSRSSPERATDPRLNVDNGTWPNFVTLMEEWRERAGAVLVSGPAGREAVHVDCRN